MCAVDVAGLFCFDFSDEIVKQTKANAIGEKFTQPQSIFLWQSKRETCWKLVDAKQTFDSFIWMTYLSFRIKLGDIFCEVTKQLSTFFFF